MRWQQQQLLLLLQSVGVGLVQVLGWLLRSSCLSLVEQLWLPSLQYWQPPVLLLLPVCCEGPAALLPVALWRSPQLVWLLLSPF